MKPKTKIEKRVALLSAQLSDITESQVHWAEQTCVESLGFLSKSKIWCSDCGHNFDTYPGYTIPTRAICPHCRQLLKIEREKEKTAKALRNEANFQESKSKFFGLRFTDEQIQVVVLDSIEQYIQEGDDLKHCVFTGGYYNKEDSLILSARMGDKRLETVEVSLSKLEVVQCRGRHNTSTPYHDRIIHLVKSNINQIKQRYHQNV